MACAKMLWLCFKLKENITFQENTVVLSWYMSENMEWMNVSDLSSAVKYLHGITTVCKNVIW